jgi:hypothetical protein
MANWAWGIAAAALVGGCVTINIYFPAAAAEKAADRIIDEVWRTGTVPGTAPAQKAPAAPVAPDSRP